MAEYYRTTVTSQHTNRIRAEKSDNLKRWQFAILVTGVSSFLMFILGKHLVWSDFYLTSKLLIREHTAAWIFTAWSIPLVLFNALFTKYRRDLFTALLLSFMPLAIRQVTLIRNYSVVAMWIFVIFVVVVTGYSFIRAKFVRKRRLSTCIERARSVAAISLIMVFSLAIGVDLFIPSLSERPIVASTAQAEHDRTVSDHEIELLNSSEWDHLSAQEKAAIDLKILEEMSAEMGIPAPTLYLDSELPGNTAAYYHDTDNTIHLWKAYLENESAYTATIVILHELYHAYQNSILTSSAINWDSPDIQTIAYFDRIWQWKQEDESYISSDRWGVSFESYYEQALETDARHFAETYVSRYIFSE